MQCLFLFFQVEAYVMVSVWHIPKANDAEAFLGQGVCEMPCHTQLVKQLIKCLKGYVNLFGLP